MQDDLGGEMKEPKKKKKDPRALSLKKSRGQFFDRYPRMPRRSSFWYYYLWEMNQFDRVSEAAVAEAANWVPERSNCPELAVALEALIEHIPDEWTEIAENIFAGRVINGESNAEAWRTFRAGCIEISFQFTQILAAYVSAYDLYVASVRNFMLALEEDVNTAEERLAELQKSGFSDPWRELEEHREFWANPAVLAGIDRRILDAPDKQRRDLQADVVNVAEEWILSHEVAHHLLGHLSKRGYKYKAVEVVRSVMSTSGLNSSLPALNNDQRAEIEADVLAFMLIARATKGSVDRNRMYGALAGAVMALVSEAHADSNWVNIETRPSHPDFITRFIVVKCLTEWLCADMPKGPIGDHPLGMLSQLTGFVNAAIQSHLSGAYPNKFREPDLLTTVNYFLDVLAEVNAKIPSSPIRETEVAHK